MGVRECDDYWKVWFDIDGAALWHTSAHEIVAPALGVVLAYQHSRVSFLLETLSEYRQHDDIFDAILVIWNNQLMDLPAGLVESSLNRGGGVAVQTQKAEKNSLNNRWNASMLFGGTTPRNTAPVLVFDDDVRHDPATLKLMVETWHAEHGQRIVGLASAQRHYVVDARNQARYLSWPSPSVAHGAFSFLLPEALVVSSETIHAYSSPSVADAHEFVDSHPAHCDDVLLHFIAALVSATHGVAQALPPIAIVPLTKATVMEDGIGLSAMPERDSQREECID